MRIPQFIAIWLLLCQFAFGQFDLSVEVSQVEAITAKAARTEPLPDRVAVFLTERDPGSKSGIVVRVNTNAKWVTLYVQGQSIVKSKAVETDWILLAPAGKYTVLIAQSDPEKGLALEGRDVEIKGTSTPPVDPPIDPPPTGDFASLTKAAKDAADRLNDPPTRAALANAYSAALTAIAGKPYDDARRTVVMARQAALNARKGPSRLVDWQTNFLQVVDAELTKVVPAGDAAKYAMAVDAIVKGLQ